VQVAVSTNTPIAYLPDSDELCCLTQGSVFRHSAPVCDGDRRELAAVLNRRRAANPLDHYLTLDVSSHLKPTKGSV
jgi:hypothetical protein